MEVFLKEPRSKQEETIPILEMMERKLFITIRVAYVAKYSVIV